MTCGFRNETSGQSWPAKTVGTDPVTEQNRNSECGSGIHQIVLVKVQDIQVRWAIVGALELVYWCVWAAYTPLVMGLAGTFIRPEAQQLGPLS